MDLPRHSIGLTSTSYVNGVAKKTVTRHTTANNSCNHSARVYSNSHLEVERGERKRERGREGGREREGRERERGREEERERGRVRKERKPIFNNISQ